MDDILPPRADCDFALPGLAPSKDDTFPEAGRESRDLLQGSRQRRLIGFPIPVVVGVRIRQGQQLERTVAVGRPTAACRIEVEVPQQAGALQVGDRPPLDLETFRPQERFKRQAMQRPVRNNQHPLLADLPGNGFQQLLVKSP